MLTSLIVSLASAALVQDAPAKTEGPWIADFDAAAKVAQKEGKDLLVDFTGSDWCIWCQRLHEEVFEHPEFVDAASKNFVLVALDFPRSDEAKAKVPNPTRNGELFKKYGCHGYPTVMLVTPDGDAFGKYGYDKGGPEPWIKNLNDKRESGKTKLAELIAREKSLAAAKGAEQGKILDDTMEELAALSEDSPFGPKLAAMIRSAYTIDAKNEQGRKQKAVIAILKSGAATDADYAVAIELDPKNAKGLREQVVLARVNTVDSEDKVKEACKWIDELDALGPIVDKDIAKQLYLNAAFWNHKFVKSPEAAKKYATKAKELGTDENPNVAKMLAEILGG